jgi:FixJ family two-component response regulator
MIYIVDDDESVRTSLMRLMRSAGFAAEAFPAAEDFLRDAASADGCHCVVIDVHLTGMSGLELQRELNRRTVVPPIVMMTAFEDPELRRRALDAGAVAFLKKPFDDSVLLDAVSKACDGMTRR